MIKYLTISIIITFISIKCFTQNTFELLFKNPETNVFVSDALEDNEGNFLISAAIKNSSYDYHQLFLKISNTGDSIASLEVYPTSGKNYILKILKSNNDDYIGLGIIKSDTSENYDFWYIKFNNNLEILSEKKIYTSHLLTGRLNAKINSNGNIIVVGISQNLSYQYDFYIFELTNAGDTLKTKYYNYSGSEFAFDILEKIDSNGYFLITSGLSELINSMGQIIELDTNFNFINIDSIPKEIYDMNNVLWINNAKYLLTGKKRYFSGGQEDVDLGILMLDTSNNIIYENYFGKPDTVDYIAYNKNLDFINPNDIYFGGVNNVFIGDPIYSTYYNTLMLNKLDSTLNLKWQKYYGGDAYYELFSILATSDGGCLLLCTRYDYLTQNQEKDIYILKVNELGEITNIAENAGIKAHNAILFPNPSTSIINILVVENYKNSTINITDISGKQIISEQIQGTSTQIDISEFQSGIYFYTILNNEEVIEGGKFVKE